MNIFKPNSPAVNTDSIVDGAVTRAKLAAGAVATNNVVSLTVADTPYTIDKTEDLILVNADAGNVTVNLPTVGTSAGYKVTIKKLGTLNTVTVSGSSIEALTDKYLVAAYDSITVMSNGTVWYIVNEQSNLIQLSEDSSGVAWPFTGGQYGDHTSLTLIPGTYSISASASPSSSGLPGGIRVHRMGVTTTSGNSGTGLSISKNYLSDSIPNASGYILSLYLSDYIVTVTSNTTYYLKGYVDATTNINRSGYLLQAKRIKL